MKSPADTRLGKIPGEIVPIRLPAVPAQIFAARAARFRELAPGHAVGEYLSALAALAEAQAIACRETAIGMDGQRLSPVRPQAEAWRESLRPILREMRAAPLPAPARAVLDRLGDSTPAEMDAFADALLEGALDRLDPAAAPFVGAALQAHWTALASHATIKRPEGAEPGCPVCGSPPVAARVQGDDKLRYLVCSLCATEWHLTRLLCSNCGAGDALEYFMVEGDSGAVKAEACGRCRTYLKLVYPEKCPSVDPFADDAATLPLDLLLAEEGYARGGMNFFLLPGAQA